MSRNTDPALRGGNDPKKQEEQDLYDTTSAAAIAEAEIAEANEAERWSNSGNAGACHHQPQQQQSKARASATRTAEPQRSVQTPTATIRAGNVEEKEEAVDLYDITAAAVAAEAEIIDAYTKGRVEVERE